MALQRYNRFDEGKDADGTYEVSSQGAASRPKGKRRALRWLGLLLLVTLLLLIFQVILGCATNTLTLVADAAHGVADVVSYAFNFSVEYLKKRGRSKEKTEVTIKIMDTWGSLISLLSLVFATVFAVAEALERLSEDVDRDSDGVGPALLFFSIMSTTCNSGLVLMYWHWHKKSIVKTPRAKTSTGAIAKDIKVACPPPPVALGESKLVQPRPSKGNIDMPVPSVHSEDSENKVQMAPDAKCMLQPSSRRKKEVADSDIEVEQQDAANPAALAPPKDVEIGAPPRRAPRRYDNDRKKGLNLCAAFAGETTAGGDAVNCQKICCRAPGEELADASECPAGAEGVGGGMLSTLHMAVHPGCTCEHHEGDALTGSPTMPAAAGEGRNLNLVAAMLHLITDVLRGLLILAVALLIMLGGVHDAGRADAVCALVVAALIAAGSVALLLRVAGRLQTFCCSQVNEKSKNSGDQVGNQNL